MLSSESHDTLLYPSAGAGLHQSWTLACPADSCLRSCRSSLATCVVHPEAFEVRTGTYIIGNLNCVDMLSAQIKSKFAIHTTALGQGSCKKKATEMMALEAHSDGHNPTS